MSNNHKRRSHRKRGQGGLNRREFFKGSAQITLAFGGLLLAGSEMTLFTGAGHSYSATDEKGADLQLAQSSQQYGRPSPGIPLLLLDE